MARRYKRDRLGRFAGSLGSLGKGRKKKGSRRTQRKYDKAVYNRARAGNRRQSVKDNAKYGAGNTKGQIRRAERKNVRLVKSAERAERSIKGKKLRKGDNKQAAFTRHHNRSYNRRVTAQIVGRSVGALALGAAYGAATSPRRRRR